MKSPIKVLSLTCLIVGLAACSGGGSSSVILSSSSSSSSEESSASASSSSFDPYEGRVNPIELSVVDLLDAPFMGGDERSFDDPKPLADYIRPEKVKMYYLDKTNDVYFLDMKTFADLFKNEVRDGYSSSVADDGNLSSWTVTKGDEIVFRLSMNAKTKTLSLCGELDATFLKSAPYGKSSENDLMQSTEEYLTGHENVERDYPFAQYGFDFFKVDGKTCYPFALLNLALNQTTERAFLFNTHEKQLFEYGPIQQLDNINFATAEGGTIGAKDYIIESNAKEYEIGPTDHPMQPHSLSLFNKKLYYFMMDSFYGLAKQKGITSMSDYLDTFDYSKNLTSDDGESRLNAYGRSIDMLNDLHSSYSASPYFDEVNNKDYHYEQTFNKDRFDLRGYLLCERASALKKYNADHGTSYKLNDMRYSADGKYGYFSFDTFDTFSTFDDGEVPEATLLTDTFYLFIKNLNEAKEKGAKRIIIDDTCNLGGYVTIMAKLLALMSKDNKAETYLRCDGNDAVLKTTVRVDSNRDGKFDVSDCFGNDFEFYILTSNFSFSCGNAFPFYAAHYDLAKILGARSGGGECCVFEYTFPTGQSFRYSSPYHVGYWDEEKKTYVGDEYGANPDLAAKNDFHDLYDLESVAATIEKEFPAHNA